MSPVPTLVRWTRFNAVGAAGVAVQLAAVAALVHAADVPAVVATAAAVEAAVLHNFLWHQRWTWRDRPVRGFALAARLLRFHLLNGVISLVGNVAIVALLAGTLRLDPLLANAVAIVACSTANFAASDRAVFSASPQAPCSTSAPARQPQ